MNLEKYLPNKYTLKKATVWFFVGVLFEKFGIIDKVINAVQNEGE